MTIEVRDVDGVRELCASGELDAASVPDLLPQLPVLLGDLDQRRGVVLDLAAVDFFDSSGVRLVDRLTRLCAAVPLRVVAPHGGPVRRVLEVVGMAGPHVVDDLAVARAQVTRAG